MVRARSDRRSRGTAGDGESRREPALLGEPVGGTEQPKRIPDAERERGESEDCYPSAEGFSKESVRGDGLSEESESDPVPFKESDRCSSDYGVRESDLVPFEESDRASPGHRSAPPSYCTGRRATTRGVAPPAVRSPSHGPVPRAGPPIQAGLILESGVRWLPKAWVSPAAW